MTQETEQWNFFEVTYGSKLYGTSTPTSDTDLKVVYIPELGRMLLGKKADICKERFDAEGNPIGDGFTMPDNGTEVEYFPLQRFVADFVAGQTYAIEMAFAHIANGPPEHGILYTSTYPAYAFVKEMVDKFANASVYSMVGFAMKQTFDYVRRGERLNDAKKVLDAINEVSALVGTPDEARLDWILDDELVLDHIAHLADLKTDVQNGGNKPQRSLELNGRSYLQSTTLSHLRLQVEKIIKQFGDRTNAAAETDVDYKSLSHAVRVYQQAIELLDTGVITFPRPNAEFLLSVKQGKEDLESVKTLLMQLDDEVQLKIKTTTIQQRTDALVKESEAWLMGQLRTIYNVDWE